MPAIGEENMYGIVISKELKIAYDNYLGGDGEEALEALSKAQKSTKDTLTLWQISFLRVKVYMLLGLDADAQEELKATAKYEKASFSNDLNSISLRGEVSLREAKFDNAREDFNHVLSSIGDWELPTSYGLPPSNMKDLVALTTAQLRAYTGMAASYVMEEKYEKAKFWAKEAEARYNAVHYVSNHSLYGIFFHSHLDSYYGRAMNMVMLASSFLGADKNQKKSDYYYDEALKFFSTINYTKGKIILLALKAQTLASTGEREKANDVALQAIEVASTQKMYDFIWRIETLRGKLLLQDKKIDEAEQALRNAANVIDLVSGELQTDFSKRRFGTGKSDLVYNLMSIDLKKKNYAQLFLDVEHGRARAFVDVMRNRSVSTLHSDLLHEIRAIDKKIKKRTIQSYAFHMQKQVQVTTGKKEEKDYLLQRLAAIKKSDHSIRATMTRKELHKQLKALEKNTARDNEDTTSRKHTSKQTQKQLREQRKVLVSKLIALEPQAAALISNHSNTVEDIQKALSSNASILYFLPVHANDKIKALLITKNSLKLETFSLTQTELTKLMQSYLLKIGASGDSLAQNTRAFKRAQKQGMNTSNIVKNPLDRLEYALSLDSITTKRVYIVGSGATTYVPWGAYAKPIEFALLPNASWILNKNKTNSTGAIIVGNPNYGGELPQLQGTVKEAQALAKLYNVKALLYKNATLSNIKKHSVTQVKILHLATHGVFYSDKPLESAIFLSKNSKLYTLSAKEIFRTPLKADLVVLSACETGMGINVAGDDLLGLPRSFFLGGTKAVVSSLWPIDDAGTKEFMLVFHKYAKEGSYEKGILKAREALKKKGYPASVYGAFVLYGTSL